MKHDRATKLHARSLYGQGSAIPAIAADTEVPERTIRHWAATEGWAVTIDPEAAAQARLVALIQMGEGKSEAQWQEMERLTNIYEKLSKAKARAQVQMAKVEEGGSVSGGKGKSKGSKKRNINEIPEDALERLEAYPLYEYQHPIVDFSTRALIWLKSRQVGATKVVLPVRALKRAITLGHDQIFVSASKKQAQIIQKEIKAVALKELGWELEGSKEEITIHKNGEPWASFQFMSTNTATAQGGTGDVYIDEAGWTPRAKDLIEVVKGMATLKQYTWMVCSTASTKNHYFWELWLGEDEHGNKLKQPNITRIKTTVHDAVAGGHDQIDIDLLREDNPGDSFANKYECQPIDDESAFFKLGLLEGCQKDPTSWRRHEGIVRIGYDPSRSRDFACLIVDEVRFGKDDKERHRFARTEAWKNKSHLWQAHELIRIAREYDTRLDKIGIDVTGAGQAVYDEVKAELGSKVVPIYYSPEIKNEMAVTSRRIMEEGRLEYEAGDRFITNSFLAIKQTGTDGGRITIRAGRTAETGHAEGAWAGMHALQFDKSARRRKSVVG